MWSALALVTIAALGLWRAEVLVRAFLPRWFDLQTERLRTPPATGSQREPLPPDLEAIALQETEPWAREQVRAALMDVYEQTQDWDAVREQYHGAA